MRTKITFKAESPDASSSSSDSKDTRNCRTYRNRGLADFNRPPPILPDPLSDEEGSVEEVIRSHPIPEANHRHGEYEDHRHSESLEPEDNDDIPDDEVAKHESESEEPGLGVKDREPEQQAVPSWFPQNVKDLFLVDRKGGQWRYQELEIITRYRAAIEKSKRRRWRSYLKAGHDRWQLQRLLKHVKQTPYSIAYLKFRGDQFRRAKSHALRRWKRLEKLHIGVKILDEVIATNFRQERILHEKKLDKKMKR